MDCPVCGDELRTIERYGVEVDICPGCKGVWLDKGELDKILEYNRVGGVPEREDERRHGHEGDEHRGERDNVDRHRSGHESAGKTRRSTSWLSDMLGGFGEE